LTPRLAAALLASIALALQGCHAPAGERLVLIDLLRQPHAEKRPIGGTFELVDHECGAERFASLAVPPASRVTWSLRLPDRAVLSSAMALEGALGASAVFRVGISDGRIYETLQMHTISSGACRQAWTPLSIELGRYSGWKFSLFYRPRKQTWQLILGVNPVSGESTKALWARPRIETDTAAAKRFYER
jgi:hypothetical protein